jgi:hypothetical protein
LKKTFLLFAIFIAAGAGHPSRLLAQSNDGEVNLNDPALQQMPPKLSKPSNKPSPEEEKIWIKSSFSTTFTDQKGLPLRKLKQHAMQWLDGFQKDTEIHSWCRSFNRSNELHCNAGNGTCDFKVRTENCQFMDLMAEGKKTSCLPGFKPEFSPDRKHRDFKVCVKTPESSSPAVTGASKALK